MHNINIQALKISKNLSDKFYWHGYIDFYESFFATKRFENIAEFGIYKGKSISWLLERFPHSQIYGADILPEQPEWPKDTRFKFTELDQANVNEIRQFLSQVSFDLIIEDGSHQPQHQINCLIEGLRALRPGGIYILEDIDTSLPSHHWWHKKIHWWKFRERKIYKEQKRVIGKGNALNALLGIDHYKRLNVPVDQDVSKLIAKNSLISEEAIMEIANQIDTLKLYRRTRLPDYCHACGQTHFEYSKFECQCGEKLFREADSMSYLLIKK